MTDSHECGDTSCRQCYGQHITGRPALCKLETDDGPVYADLASITFVGAAVTKPGHDTARRVAFGSNVYVFVLNSVENLTALGLIDEAMALQLAQAKRKRRGRKPRKAEGVVTA